MTFPYPHRTQAEIERARPSRLLPLPDDWCERAAVMGDRALQAHYDRGRSTIVRWRRESGVAPPPRPKSVPPAPRVKRKVVWNGQREAMRSVADPTAAGQAQAYLQRFVPVFRASTVRKGANGYVVDGRAMTTEAMMAMAVRKGHDPDAWRRL